MKAILNIAINSAETDDRGRDGEAKNAARDAADAAEAKPVPHAHGALDRQSLPHESVEASLSHALTLAAAAGRFDVVAQLAKELEARRLATSDVVVALDARWRR